MKVHAAKLFILGLGLWVVLYALASFRSPLPTHAFFRSLPVTRPLVIAHRGGGGRFPENTLVAFAGAIRLGADILEMDVHLTADGIPVVIHDATVDRTTDGTGRVDHYTLAELQQLDAGYRFHPPGSPDEHPYRGHGVTIPTLREVLATFPEMPMIVEVKEDEPGLVEAVIGLIREFEREDRTFPASFHPRALGRLRAGLPDTPTHASRREATRFILAAWLGLEGLTRPSYGVLMLPARRRSFSLISRRLIRAAHSRGLVVLVWGVNDIEEMQRLARRGVDGWITGRPDLAEVAKQR